MVAEYHAGASGKVAPFATITCGGLQLPSGLAFDALQHLYVASSHANAISVFAPNAKGCVTNERQIKGSNTLLASPIGVALAGSMLFVSNPGAANITEYSDSASGNEKPSVLLFGHVSGPQQIALDSSQNLYVADYGANAVYVFPRGATINTPPSKTIQGNKTQLIRPQGVAVTATLIFVSVPSSNSILEFSRTANGNVSPAHVIHGAHTKLNFPVGLLVH